jgi:hypothetical protein
MGERRGGDELAMLEPARIEQVVRLKVWARRRGRGTSGAIFE